MSTEQKFLIDCIIGDVAKYLIEDQNITIREALDILFTSQFYEKLMDLDTGMYCQSPAYNYEYLKHELAFGKVA